MLQKCCCTVIIPVLYSKDNAVSIEMKLWCLRTNEEDQILTHRKDYIGIDARQSRQFLSQRRIVCMLPLHTHYKLAHIGNSLVTMVKSPLYRISTRLMPSLLQYFGHPPQFWLPRLVFVGTAHADNPRVGFGASDELKFARRKGSIRLERILVSRRSNNWPRMMELLRER